MGLLKTTNISPCHSCGESFVSSFEDKEIGHKKTVNLIREKFGPQTKPNRYSDNYFIKKLFKKKIYGLFSSSQPLNHQR